ncbi:flagellar motor protein MotB [Aestuariivirga sp.]|uniref:flagellar motor protein MotB n=1 Tax=Aestuariivirga sp. TaxID=2650926 RepID=UPI0025C6E17D|nr:flagellar motor protein MotB [Aestuariivirga sp.]MCA3554248.1 OmpA family protein [Aestuariivirga sp.]
MSGGADADKPEIVIVRRRVVDDGAATKAGAWKIAYADFVTAMMAFFLVMWLINASNEETRAQVASYFNPIKLTDTSTGSRSLKDVKDTRNPQNRKSGETGEGSPPAKKDTLEEAEMMANPPKSLDRVAKTVSSSEFRNAGLESDVEIAPSLKPDKSNPGVGDPFDPRSWEKAGAAGITKGDPATQGAASDQQPGQPGKQTTEEAGKDKTVSREAAGLLKEVASRLGQAPQQLSRQVEIKAINGGVLVSLTESADFEMFKMGSAEPEPRMLKLVEALASALQSRPGKIIVRGHTDSRPYRNKYYDNWQLSTARANQARYMLVRGGLDGKRIRRIEGVADLEPRNAADPQAPENRRIEIFMGQETP